MKCTFSQTFIFLHPIRENTGENRPIAGKEAVTEILMRLLEQSSEFKLLIVFIEESKTFIFVSICLFIKEAEKVKTIGSQ
jgi:hypothetical protein